MFELSQYDKGPVGPSHHESGAKGRGIHPNHNHPEIARAEGQNHRRRRFFGICIPETLLKYHMHRRSFVV